MTQSPVSQQVLLRAGVPTDAEACGRILYDGFSTIAAQHNFPPDVPSPEAGIGLMRMLLSHPGFFSVVAEAEGAVVGSNFLDERSEIVGLGPISVDPVVQNRQIGRRLMAAALDRVQTTGTPGVRLLQSAYHSRSLSLYATLGFQVREPIACLQGPPIGVPVAGHTVRRAREADLEACDRVCRFVHGHDRHAEVQDAVTHGSAKVVEHAGRITGYATDIGFFAHAVAETNRDLMALIADAAAFAGPGLLVPLRNAQVFQWCLSHKLRVVQVLTLMTRGLYNEPAGGYLPSILY